MGQHQHEALFAAQKEVGSTLREVHDAGRRQRRIGLGGELVTGGAAVSRSDGDVVTQTRTVDMGGWPSA